MKSLVLVTAGLVLLGLAAQARMILGDFEPPTYIHNTPLNGQDGWVMPTGGGQTTGNWGSGYELSGTASVYMGANHSAKKAFAGTGLTSLPSGAIVSNLGQSEGARNNVIDVGLYTDFTNEAGLLVRLDDTVFPHDFVVSYNTGSGWVASTLPPLGGGGGSSRLWPWQLEFELDFIDQEVTLWLTDIHAGGPRSGETIPFALGTAAGLLANGGWGIRSAAGSAATLFDDVLISNLPEPTTLALVLLGPGALLLRRRR